MLGVQSYGISTTVALLDTGFWPCIREGRRTGLQPLQWLIPHEMHRATIVQNPVKAGLVHLLGREKAQGLKPGSLLDIFGTTEVVP
jgi:hypothetical protein